MVISVGATFTASAQLGSYTFVSVTSGPIAGSNVELGNLVLDATGGRTWPSLTTNESLRSPNITRACSDLRLGNWGTSTRTVHLVGVGNRWPSRPPPEVASSGWLIRELILPCNFWTTAASIHTTPDKNQ